jgi:outer membrane lipoprotein-sorting protein
MKFFLTILFFSSLLSVASEANQNKTAVKVESPHFTPDSFRADFNQEFKSITGKLKSSKGSIEYSFPSKIRIKEFKDNSEFVSNEKNSWYYVPPFIKTEKGTVQVDQAGSMVLGKIFDSLKPGLRDTDFFKVKNTKDVKVMELEFTAKGKQDWKLEKALLHFSNPEHTIQNFQKFEITYTDKKNVVLTFFNIMTNVKFPADYFIFKIPANTKILK